MLAYLKERYAIFHKKEVLKLPPPWSSDPVFQQKKFCNVFIEDDRGSIYIAGKLKEVPLWEQKMNRLIIYRIINNPAFFDECGFPEGNIKEHLVRVKKFNSSIRNQAYLAKFSAKYGNNHKDIYINMLPDYLETINALSKTTGWVNLKTAWLRLKKFGCGCGEFVAFVITVDMLRNGLLSNPNDDWIHIGPGAQQTLKMLCGDADSTEACITIRDRVNGALNFKRPFDLLDVEHNLCEFRKYINIKSGLRPGKKFTA